MKGFRNCRIAWSGCCLALVAALHSGCVAVSVARAGVSAGSTVVRTTGSVGASAIKVGLGSGDSEEELDQNGP